MSSNMVEIFYLVEVSIGWDSWQQKQVDGEIYTEHLIKGKHGVLNPEDILIYC